ncbi:MAG: 50S ribosomal protein L1 [Chitinivibrionales bacterium]|nr:50S ribosomal protein L1 [Chitinivibrionales bacterium]MBD3356193.1 50S ribosomal protein L1 [Chitinivibrionales bacterium]
MKHGKKWTETRKKIDKMREYGVVEAVEFLRDNSVVKFDESVEIAVNLGVDPRKSDQAVRSAVVLPHGIGKTVRVLAFAQGEKAKEASEAGADYVGAEDMAEKISGGWLEFDAVVATPDMMKVVGKLGKILGPRGMMPNPKVGTVTMNVGEAVGELKRGKVEFRVEKGGILHAPVGKLSFDTNKIVDNIRTFMDAVVKAKPSAAKGHYIKRVTLSSTMGQGLRLSAAELK